MKYLTGASNAGVLAICRRAGIGLMAQPSSGYAAHIPLYPFWAADNGCFAQGPAFDIDRFLRWLVGLREHYATCLFAVAPDVYGDAAATLARSLPVLPQLRALGFPAALVAQNGLTPDAVPWGSLDVLFLGGAGRWKLGHEAEALVTAARQRGVRVHTGRVNSLRRLVASQVMGCDSADGTYLKFGPDVNLPRLLGWLAALRRQPPLQRGAAS